MNVEMPIVLESFVSIHPSGATKILGVGVAGDEIFPFEGEYLAYCEVADWISSQDEFEEVTGTEYLTVWSDVADEVRKAFVALEGLRQLHKEMHLGRVCPDSSVIYDGGGVVGACGCFSAADQCAFLYTLLAKLDMEVQ